MSLNHGNQKSYLHFKVSESLVPIHMADARNAGKKIEIYSFISCSKCTSLVVKSCTDIIGFLDLYFMQCAFLMSATLKMDLTS